MIRIKYGSQNDNIKINIFRIGKSSVEGIRKAFYYIGKDLQQTSQQSILSKNKTGKVYLVRLGKIKKRHQASAEGQAPANLTGNLRKSIGYEVRGGDQMEFGSRNGPPAAGLSPKQNVADYAPFLEFGTSKMGARPFIQPSLMKNEGNIIQHFERELEKELNK